MLPGAAEWRGFNPAVKRDKENKMVIFFFSSSAGLKTRPSAAGLTRVLRNVEQDSNRHQVRQQRRSSVTYQSQRNPFLRQQTQYHANIDKRQAHHQHGDSERQQTS